MKGTKQMIRFLLLAVHATPFHTPYKDATTCADYNKDTNRLAVGTTDAYVANVIHAWNTSKCTDILLEGHKITGWRVVDGTGIYLTHTTTTDGRSWNTYLPDITDVQKVTADRLNPLVDMYTDISSRPGMTTKDIVNFVVSASVNDFIAIKDPTPAQIIDILPALSQTMRALNETIVLNVYGQDVSNAPDRQMSIYSKLPTVLTVKVANALQSSNSAAVQAFTQLCLYISCYKLQQVDEIFSHLAQKIKQVSSLNLGGISSEMFTALLSYNSEFVRLFTSPATLATINDNDTFVKLANECSEKCDEPCENEAFYNTIPSETKTFFDKNLPSLTRLYFSEEIVRESEAAYSTAGRVKEWEALKELCEKRKKEEDKALREEQEKKIQELIDAANNPVDYESKFLEKTLTIQILQEIASQETNRHDKQNEKHWQAISAALSSEEVKNEFSQYEQKKKLYAEGIIHIITEMKRRFEAAKLQAPKGVKNIYDAAAEIWTRNEVIISMISPEAAAQLKEMAEYVQ